MSLNNCKHADLNEHPDIIVQFVTTLSDNTLLPVPQYFPQVFPTQTGRAARDLQCLS